jgi:hypothetical protein
MLFVFYLFSRGMSMGKWTTFYWFSGILWGISLRRGREEGLTSKKYAPFRDLTPSKRSVFSAFAGSFFRQNYALKSSVI